MTTQSLLTKKAAAKKLGVSVSTFDRFRASTGLQPVRGIKQKPVLFSEQDILVRVSRLNGDRGVILSLAEIKARANAGK
jgi:hypothetical protein